MTVPMDHAKMEEVAQMLWMILIVAVFLDTRGRIAVLVSHVLHVIESHYLQQLITDLKTAWVWNAVKCSSKSEGGELSWTMMTTFYQTDLAKAYIWSTLGGYFRESVGGLIETELPWRAHSLEH